MNLTPPKREVIWRDSNIITGQTDEVPGIATIKTIGYIVHEDKESVTLARDLIGDEWRGTITIPKENVISDVQINKTNKR